MEIPDEFSPGEGVQSQQLRVLAYINLNGLS